MKCCICDGKKQIKTKINDILLECYECNGTGYISDDRFKWIKNGEIIRKKRLKNNLSLYHESKRLGVDIKKYSDIENGKIENSIYV